MEHSKDNHGFPSVPASFRDQPHKSTHLFNLPQPSLATPAADPGTPIFNAASVAYPSTLMTATSSRWIASVLPSSRILPSTHTPTLASPSLPSATGDANHASDTAPTAQGGGTGLSNGVKIGVIVGITVVVILAIIACGLGTVDCRKRWKRRQTRDTSRTEELSALEAELRIGRTAQRRERESGLWADLKVRRESAEEGVTAKKDTKESRERSSVGLWERVGAMRDRELGISSSKDSASNAETLEREPEWLPAYMPRERASPFSSAGSLAHPMTGKPVMPRTLFDGDHRR